MKIILRNLSRETTQEELAALLKPFGTVQSCDLVLDRETKLSKGFAFAEMPKIHEAKAAIQGLNGKDIGGSKIRVKKADVAPK
jgi:RNA recognition motif-containing protein